MLSLTCSWMLLKYVWNFVLCLKVSHRVRIIIWNGPLQWTHSDEHKWGRNLLWRSISRRRPLEVCMLNVGMTLNLSQVAQGFVGLKTGIRLLSLLPALLLSYVLHLPHHPAPFCWISACLSVFCKREIQTGHSVPDWAPQVVNEE